MEEKTMNMKCECGKPFSLSLRREMLYENHPNRITSKWGLRYCESCYEKRSNMALERCGEFIDIIIKDEDFQYLLPHIYRYFCETQYI